MRQQGPASTSGTRFRRPLAELCTSSEGATVGASVVAAGLVVAATGCCVAMGASMSPSDGNMAVADGDIAVAAPDDCAPSGGSVELTAAKLTESTRLARLARSCRARSSLSLGDGWFSGMGAREKESARPNLNGDGGASVLKSASMSSSRTSGLKLAPRIEAATSSQFVNGKRCRNGSGVNERVSCQTMRAGLPPPPGASPAPTRWPSASHAQRGLAGAA